MADEVRMYLRSKTDGHLFAYSEVFANHPDLEVVSEAKAYPELHMPKHVKAKANEGHDDGLDLSGGITDVSGTEKPPETDPALGKQAGKGLPK